MESSDVYRLKVGLRSVKWTEKEFLINDKPFYFRGFGRHEDFNVSPFTSTQYLKYLLNKANERRKTNTRI